MQIRSKLTLLFVFIAAGILAGVLFAVHYFFRQSTEGAFYRNLESKSDLSIQTTINGNVPLEPLTANWLAPDDGILPYQNNTSVYNQNYERVFSLRPDAPPVSAKALQNIYQTENIRFRHYNLQALGRKVTNVNGVSYAIVVEGYFDPMPQIQLRNILIFGFFSGLILVALAGWYYAGQALEPMSRIVAEVAEMHPGDMSRRVESADTRDEIGRLAKTFNQLLDRVEHAFKMQRMFLSNVSHELRNPLTAIKSQLEVALQRDRTPDVYQKALKSILEDVRALSETEADLLQLAHLYNDPKAIPFSPFRLDELLWQAKQQLQKRHPDFRVQIEFGAMPEQDHSLFIQANEGLILTALLNLMNNACKYSPDKQVLIKTDFKADGKHSIAICDNGPGIPPEEQKLIFEPFYRSPRHLNEKGTGVGLSLVQAIFSRHQIALRVESPETGGTVFTMIFPGSGRQDQDSD